MQVLKDWLDQATPAQRERLAAGADTSVQYLRHVAAGRKNPGSDIAARIELSSSRVKGQPFSLNRWDISTVCRDCSQRCGK